VETGKDILSKMLLTVQPNKKVLTYAIVCTPMCSQHGHSLWGGRSGDRIPLGERFSASVHTGSEAQSTAGTLVTGSLPVVKRPGRGADHPPLLRICIT
jgi:hypothetical protein